MPSKSGSSAVYRMANDQDVEKIFNLISPFSKKNILLPRSKEGIIADLPLTWVVADNNKLLATACLIEYQEDLYEIRAFAVDLHYQRSGIGKKLIEFILTDFKKQNTRSDIRIFAFTYVPEFFMKLGMLPVEKDKFPKKIFDDCQYCFKINDCHEVAMQRNL